MAEAWFIVPIVGDGKSVETPFAAQLTPEVTAYVAVIGVDAITGAPKFSWALVQASGLSFTNLLSFPGVFQIPAPSAAIFGTISATQQQVLLRAFSHYSIPVSPTSVQTMAAVIKKLASLQEPAFDLGNFAVNVSASAVL